jgi:membrane protease YdiL (CAAX protease family)
MHVPACRSDWAAVLATSLVFSLVHFTREGFLPLMLLGLVFGGVYVQTRNLLPSMLLHSLWNVLLLLQIAAAGSL